MARLMKQLASGNIYIALDGAVGQGAPNAREDVGTVQFALSVLSGGEPSPYGMGSISLRVPGQRPIGVDGAYGPQTKAYIDAYQQLRKNTPGPSGGGLPPPAGTFSGRSGGGWPFYVLEQDVRYLRQREIVEVMQYSSAAPGWLKAAFFN